MAPERLLHASTGHHDATRSRLVRIYIFIQIVTFPIHPFLLSLNASFSCKDRDGVMGIQSNTYARTFNQPSIPCGCRGQHNTQWNFSVSHTTQKQSSIIICFKKKNHHVSIMHGITPHVSSESHTRSVFPFDSAPKSQLTVAIIGLLCDPADEFDVPIGYS